MSVRKPFTLSEWMNAQIGLNAYNFLNHANYGAPYPNTGGPFGLTLFAETPQPALTARLLRRLLT